MAAQRSYKGLLEKPGQKNNHASSQREKPQSTKFSSFEQAEKSMQNTSFDSWTMQTPQANF
jgi:hypothetical protein